MKSIEGKVVFQRMDSDECMCCDGNHVYGKEIEIESYPSVIRGLKVESVSDFIRETVITTEGIENKRVRITLEVLD